MTIKTRQIICIFLYLTFFIATPLIIAYAAGYKFNFNKNRTMPFSLQKTGMFILDSQPPNAKIFINNQIQQNLINKIFFNKTNNITTPAKIKNLLPGEYTIKLELPGYWPWEKKLRITSGNSTYAENIFLFKQSAPVLIKATEINNLANKNTIESSDSEVLSRFKKNNNIKYAELINDSKLIYANDFEIWLNDLADKKQTLITRISDNITGIAWHPSNNYIIYSTDKTINVIEMDEREKRSNTELIKFDKISSLFINPKGTTLYFQAKVDDQEGLYKLNIQ
ncbi:MAG: PEGA domain-containing protein [bacterium]|nr:PEGA domain-containing protein [bacterium]